MSRLSGQPIPETIRNKPKLLPGLDLYLEAFFDLDADRSIGFSPGRIPWTAIHKYATVYEFNADQFDDLVYYISAMDVVHLSRIADNAKAD